MLDMSREYSSFFPDARHIADPHITGSDYGMSAVSIQAVFAELRSQLVPVVAAITSQPPVDNSCLHQHYPEAEQLAFSQSRLWENLVGRSRPFWEYFYPQLQAHFPNQLGTVTLEIFYRAINRVDRSPIRTDADEITYNLHVMIRFDLELDLLDRANAHVS
jgi:Zn-dependent M32 family carboxypeptidase